MALAVVVVGIWAVLRIFPPGFGTIDRSKQASIAARLASQEVERWKLRQDDLPEAIVYRKADGTVDTSFDPDSLVPYEANSKWQPNSVHKPRTVIGEGLSVPTQPISIGGQPYLTIPLYQLAYAPIGESQGEVDPDQPGVNYPIIVYTSRLTRVEKDPRQTWSQQAAGLADDEYLIDVTTGIVYLNAANSGHKFRLGYTWLAVESGSPRLHDTVGDVITAQPYPSPPPAATWSQLTVSEAGAGGFQRIITNSEDVHLALRYVTNLPVNQDEFTIVRGGSVAAPPYQATDQICFQRNNPGLRVRVDYTTRDWEIVREELAVGSDGVVKLMLSGLKSAAWRNPPRDNVADPLTPGGNDYVWALDLDNGVLLDNNTPGRFTVNYREGIVTFANSADWGRTFRFFYRVRDNWVIQPIKATGVYHRLLVYPPPPGTPTHNTFSWDGSSTTIAFAPSEAGKMVLVDYYHGDPANRTLVPGELHRISGGATPTILLDYSDVLPQENNYVLAKGVSFRVRVTWVGPGASTSVGGQPLGEMWHRVEADGYLTRPQAGE